MRLQSFNLDRFGHFENKNLDLSSDAIHIIHGPNASGKSTIRIAVVELLFGIDERTSYDFRFEKSQLRLTGKLATQDGKQHISFSRYKRRAKSLMGEGDLELEESALYPFLSGMDKATFLDLYVMDQEALRKGGEYMLSAEGDVGRSLFAASSGFADLSTLRETLKDELDEIALVGQKRKTNKLWKREDEYNQARDRQRASLLRKGDWDAAKKALAQAQEKIEALTEERQSLEATRSLLERIKAVSLILPRLDRNKAILVGLANVPVLPNGFAVSWRKAESDLHSAVDAEATAKTEKARVDAERLALPKDADELIAFTEEVESLHQAIGNTADLRQAKLKLERDVQHDTERLTISLAELGSIDLESNERLLAAIPARITCAKSEELIAERVGIDTALNGANRRKDRAQESLNESILLLETLSGAADPSDAEAKWKAIIGQGNVRRIVSQAQRKVDETRTVEAVVIAKMVPWTGTAEEIIRLSLPSSEAVSGYETKWHQSESDFNAGQDAERKAKAKLRQIDEEIAPQKLGGEVPTESAVRTARSERDDKWAEIAGPAEAGRRIPAQSLANYSGLVKRADDLIDLCVASNELPALLRNRATLVAEVEDTEGRLKQIRDRQTQERQNWKKLWQGLSWPHEEIPEPQMMKTWLAHHKNCLIAIDARAKAEAAQTEAETEERDVKEAVTKIAQLVNLSLATDSNVDQIRDQVVTAIAQSRRKWDDLKRSQVAVQQHEKEFAAATKECDRHLKSLSEWQRKWTEAMPLLYQKTDTEPSDCRHILALWGTIRDQHTARSGNQSRLDGVIRDLESHEQRVRAFIGKIGVEKALELNLAEDWALWPAKLHQNLQEAIRVSLEIKAAEKACTNAAYTHERCSEVLAVAKRGSDDLRSSASLAKDANVAETIDQADKKRHAQEQYSQAEADLHTAGGGLPEAKLREEVASIEPDQVKAQLSTLGTRALTLDDSVTQASQEHLLATQNLSKLEEKTGFTEAALEAATAAQDIKQLTHRWMRLRAAQILLDRAVERYRKANEGPLITRASEIFSAIVRDRMPDDFTELGVDYDNPEKPFIVARRNTGTSCSVPKMSTGTRDQLWLSLRIAALERRAENIEPMPFLADDLFDSSDEARSVAMLTAIAQLANHTQVIVFTHHEHVANMALATLGARAKLHRLEAASK